jgi:hypothetical protein
MFQKGNMKLNQMAERIITDSSSIVEPFITKDNEKILQVAQGFFSQSSNPKKIGGKK